MKNEYVKFSRYTLLLFAIFLTGCAKNLAPVKAVAPVTEPTETNSVIVEVPPSEKKVLLDEKPLNIDTLHYSVHTRLTSINPDNSYFDKKAQAKTNEFYILNNFQ